MHQRLLQFINAENISQSQLADKLGVARASISHILSGRNNPGYDFILNMTKAFPALNIDWLITGNGKIYKDQSTPLPQTLFTPEDNTSKSPELEKVISKIIIYYSDNTFVEIK